MRQKSGTSKDAADRLVRAIKRKTRWHHSAEEKIRIVLAGLRDVAGIAGFHFEFEPGGELAQASAFSLATPR